MTTYWLVGEKPLNNNIQQSTVSTTIDPSSPQHQQVQSQQCQRIVNITGNGTSSNHSLALSPTQQCNINNSMSNIGNTIHQSDNVPNHNESGPNAPLLMPAGSIPRA